MIRLQGNPVADGAGRTVGSVGDAAAESAPRELGATRAVFALRTRPVEALDPAPKGRAETARGRPAPGNDVKSERPEWARLRVGMDSIPDILFIIRHVVFLQELPVFLLEAHFAVMLRLIADVLLDRHAM